MPSLQITDAFGLNVNVVPGPALSRYIQRLEHLKLEGFDLHSRGAATLADPGITSLQVGVYLDTPSTLNAGPVNLQISAGLAGEISVFIPKQAGALLFQPDLYGDNVAVDLRERYVSFQLAGSVALAASAAADRTTFAFGDKQSLRMTNYRRFRLDSDPPVTLLEAIETTIQDFRLPADYEDLAGMPDGAIAAWEGDGALTFSATANLLCIANPLALAELPVLGALDVTPSATVTVGSSFAFSGAYQIRARKIDAQRLHIGFYKQHQAECTISASANAGVSATLGDKDLLALVIHTISNAPGADNQAIAAGLPPEQVAAIGTAIRFALNRSLSIGASAELDAVSESDAMFLYEIETNRIGTVGKTLIAAALRGDLSAITGQEDSLPEGLRAIKTLVSRRRTLKQAFKINLLGLYNTARISSLVVEGSVAWDALSGELVITDRATAARIGISMENHAADSRKFRHVLAESFLITAAYRAGGCVSGPSALSARQSYFDQSARSDARFLRDQLLVGVGLGLLTKADAEAKVPAGAGNFGLALASAETAYDDAAVLSLFLEGDDARTAAEYDQCGRDAIQFLVQHGDSDDYRLLTALNDALWANMRRIGNTTSTEFAALFTGLSHDAIQVIGTDYDNIAWWSDTMNSTARKLQIVRAYLTARTPSPDDPVFLAMRRDLARHLARTATLSSADFGGPWGLLAMHRAAARSGAKLLITSPTVNLQLSNDVQLGTLMA